MYKYGIFIGRFMPYHKGHLNLTRFALQNVEELIVILGSCNVSRSIKNPWSAEERRQMILSCLSFAEQERVVFLEANDFVYNDNRWITTIQSQVDEITDGSEDVALVGEEKDRSSFYLRCFPQWTHLDAGDSFIKGLDATKIRAAYFEGRLAPVTCLPDPVWDKLQSDMGKEEYHTLVREYEFTQSYKAAWSKAPYAPTFVTVDAVVIQSGHVLVVKRKSYPGKGLFALPGGFLNQHERIQDAAIRELKEETRISLPKEDLHAAIVDQKVFDHPDRSTRGRTITHAFCLNLGTGKLPRVKGDDDAEHACWLSFTEAAVRQNEWFEDHFHIFSHFTQKF